MPRSPNRGSGSIVDEASCRGIVAGVVIGVARDVEPVAAPALAVVRGASRRSTTFSNAWGEASCEGVDFLRCGRQAGEIVGGAADKVAFSAGFTGASPAIFQASQNNKPVDRGFRPLRIPDRGGLFVDQPEMPRRTVVRASVRSPFCELGGSWSSAAMTRPFVSTWSDLRSPDL